MNFILREPKADDEQEILKMCKEFEEADDEILFEGISNFKNMTDYNEWLKKLEDNKCIEDRNPNYSNQTTYILVDVDNNIYGACNIRHHLKGDLINHGGNIGHAIRPSKRKMGIGTILIPLELEKCNEFNIEKALLIVRVENIASNKTLLKNGAVMDNPYKDETTGQVYNRYWIETKIKER